MGIKAAFKQGGFDKITDQNNLKVSKINHAATLDVNVKGTEAAAATALEFVVRFADEPEMKNVVIDKPFIFFIRDQAHKTILFAGKYSNPTI